MIYIAQAIQSLRPGAQWFVQGNTYEGLEWLDTTQTKPTEAEVNAEVARLEAEAPLKATKEEAKRRIAASDWSVLPDVGISNQAAFVTYRAALRNLIINPVTNPVWPTEPEPIWS